MEEDCIIELYVCDTKEPNPQKDIKQVGVVVFKDDEQTDKDADKKELGSLIKCLTNYKKRILKSNTNSKPTNKS